MSQDGIAKVEEPGSVDELCAEAMQAQLAGNVAAASKLYLEVLQAQPRHAIANHCFGMLHVQEGRAAAGLSYLMVALEAQPQTAEYWLGYLEGLLAAGLAEDAEAALRHGRRHGLRGRAADAFEQRLQTALSDPAAAAKDEEQLLQLIKAGDFLEAWGRY